MSNLENWQPIFRFLERIDENDLVGIFFSLVCLIGVFAVWYWVVLKGGANVWEAGIISWNRRLGVNVKWVTPFLLKVAATILLIGSVLGLSLALLAKIGGGA
jgi:hypothetical protein